MKNFDANNTLTKSFATGVISFALTACGSGGDGSTTTVNNPNTPQGNNGLISNVRAEPSPALIAQDNRPVASTEEIRQLLAGSQTGTTTSTAQMSTSANTVSTALSPAKFDVPVEIAGQIFTQIFDNGPRTVSSLDVRTPNPTECPDGGTVTIKNFEGTDEPSRYDYFNCQAGNRRTNGFLALDFDPSSNDSRGIVYTRTNLESDNAESIIKGVGMATEDTQNYEYENTGFWTFYSILPSRPEAYFSYQLVNTADRSVINSFGLRNILYSEYLTPNQTDAFGSYETYGKEFYADFDGNVNFPTGPSKRFRAKLETVKPVVVALQSNSSGTRFFDGLFRIRFADDLYLDVSPQPDNTFLIQVESDGSPGYEETFSTR